MAAARCLMWSLVAWSLVVCLVSGYGEDGEDDYGEEETPLDALMDARERRAEALPADAAGDSRWTLGLGVLSNMQNFFENLRNNLESLETLPAEEKDVLLGRNMPSADNDRSMRPRATAAYLHALRNHRPSHKIRNFVSAPEPASLRNSNMHDPNYLWTGLGRRR
ncbi:uncharacterized protein LOC134533534 isoform X2 [Bacillus rossius redtenbacheri]|uniref:uncharacterized protein LOC134533534 isoform X2 n=1 Tax=Bacillus rossius redtenbacheri TaxID=93214 RepID=UPI002FDD5081